MTKTTNNNLLRSVKKSNKGITLVALAATVVVLLILAGITINMAFGDNGVIKKAEEASNKTQQDQENDTKTLMGLKDELNYMLNSSIINLTLDKEQVEMLRGETIQLTATVLPEDFENKEVNWISSDESVVTVENGIVKAVAIGEATITVTTSALSDRKAECKIVVKSSLAKLVGKASSDTNQTVEDEYGNKVVVPAGFVVKAHTGTELSDVTYGYTGDTNSPAVQDGIVVENESDGNQFVWIPIGEIKNKDNTTTTITLGRYSDFTVAEDGTLPTPAQVASITDYDTPVSIWNYYFEVSSNFTGATVGETTYNAASEYGNTKAYDLGEWISTTLDNGGYYIARYEASNKGNDVPVSKSGQTVWVSINQLNAAIAAKKAYSYSIDAQYYSDLINSYAWDTAIIFIEAYEDSTYANKNNSTSCTTTGTNNDKVCNIHDMSGNLYEWTTETSTKTDESDACPCVHRGGRLYPGDNTVRYSTKFRNGHTVDNSYSYNTFRFILCFN